MNFERGALGTVGVLLAALLSISLSGPTSVTAHGTAHGTAHVSKVSIGLAVPERAAKAELLDWETATGTVAVSPAKPLSKSAMHMGYDLESVISGKNRVPRLFVASFPSEIAEIRENRVRKAVFFKSVLPLVLQANEEILENRKRLWDVRYQAAMGEGPNAAGRLWLEIMAERYGVKNAEAGIRTIDALLDRVDIIPPSLALAQAAEESGWGTSRFAREGNAVFGQWTFAKNGSLTPLRRDKGKMHNIRAFGSLIDSVRAYARNLNTHRAYRHFRRMRAEARGSGAPLNGRKLAGMLKSYSVRGAKYVETLHSIIDANGLRRLDDARLDGDAPISGPTI